MKIAIVGQGAIGSLFAYYWRAYLPLVLVREIPAQAVKLFLLDGTSVQLVPHFESIVKPKDTQLDCLFITIKSYQIAALIVQLRVWLPEQTSLVLVQNGMGGAEALASAFPNNPLYVGTTTDAVFKQANKTYQVTAHGRLDMGKWQQFPCQSVDNEPRSKKTPLEDAIYQFLADHPNLHWHTNIRIALYQKLAINAVINPLTALLNIKNGQLIEHNGQVSILKAEISAIYAASLPAALTSSTGPLAASALHQLIDGVITSTANNFSSMQQDVFYARQTEVDAVLGYLLRMGAECGIDTPLMATLYKEIKSLR